ncbi:hypothetical protein [Comamonas antarctica]|uniref:hypothetical protein n=1 Tax=Comamonas antarctica TaxID=2743470 RepID=UPI001FC8B78B|nr:hypothetical protein [Comamonas antarctica]
MHLFSLPGLRRASALALFFLAAGPALAQCAAADEATHETLLGHWQAQFSAASEGAAGEGEAAAALPMAAELELTPHPELAASVRGRLQRAGSQALLAGDVDQGDFTLEESINGTNISATWIGQVVPDSCGKEIRGTWTQENPPLSLSFVLRKQTGQ